MRRRGNLDSNHPDIVAALRGIGASFLSLADLGEGKPDGLIGFRGRNRIVEIKDGKKPPSKRKPREKQEDFASTWNGEPVYLVQSIEDALEVATADVVPARLRLDPRPALERAARGALDDHARHVAAFSEYLSRTSSGLRRRVAG